MKTFFKGVTESDDNGFMMVSCGRSNDGNSYVVTTEGMKSTDVVDLCPEVAEPKECSELIATLLNEYYNKKFPQ